MKAWVKMKATARTKAKVRMKAKVKRRRYKQTEWVGPRNKAIPNDSKEKWPVPRGRQQNTGPRQKNMPRRRRLDKERKNPAKEVKNHTGEEKGTADGTVRDDEEPH
jgi:hypothetical protein